MRTYWVYILKCSDDSYYTGVCNNLERRIAEHQQGVDSNCYTYTRRPVECIFVEDSPTIIEAIEREKQIKKWSRAKKEALIHADYKRLIELSKSRSRHGSTSSP
ncbi:MAG: GIY-YIG nuclease family protein [Candidatus Kerfeldbacteria bacterium]|nr:GIY-YIG nuclease family protein [Candidatus Kerfeldbacteria bacterium]